MTEEQLGIDKDQMKAAIDRWLAENPDQPPLVRQALSSYISLLDTLEDKSSAMRRLLKELRLSFGIIPKSEKRGNYGKKKTKRSKRTDIVAQIEDARAKKKKYGHQMRKQDKKAKCLEAKLKELDDIELSEKDNRELDEEERIFDEALALGDGRVDPECLIPAEDLFTGLNSEHEEHHEDCLLSDESKAGSKRVFSEERERLDLEIKVTTKVLHVEKAEVIRGGEKTIISASTHDHGPAGMNVMWNFLSQMSILVGQFGMPMTRLASLVSTPDQDINPERIVRYFHFVARGLLRVYEKMFSQHSIASILSGDDTSTRTLEVTRGLKSEDEELSWKDYATKDAAKRMLDTTQKPSLRLLLGSQIDFVSDKKSGSSAKRQFNTTLVHGRSEPGSASSTIVFFKSHFGSFGDLVEKLLAERDPGQPAVRLVSDLASTNNVSSDNFKITRAGCAAHARRRFAKADDGDLTYRDLVLSIFDLLYSHEECLDLTGRNAENTLAVRQNCSRPLWDKLKAECEHIVSKHSPKSSLAEAARYVIKNLSALTAYLDDARLPLTNDLSERLLRPEKQIQAAALFRNSIEGRIALDIIRTIIQTCTAAQVQPAEYIQWVLKSDAEDVKRDPGAFTPFARSKQLDRES